MIDEKFSASAFAKCGYSSKKSRKLANELADEIARQIHEVVLSKFHEITKQLNSIGHNLKLYEPIKIGDISYRDDEETNSSYKCMLRVAFDSTVSTGYAHLSGEEIDSEQEFFDSHDPNNYPDSTDLS